MKLQSRTYHIVTGTCFGVAVFCAILFDRFPGNYRVLAGTIMILAALASIGTHFYNLGFFERSKGKGN